MKRCPQCHRTYSDETLSFCIADGQLLSASYQDPAATLPLNPRVTGATQTVVFPAPLSPEKAKSIIRRNWIAGAVGLPIGALALAIQISTIPDSGNQPFAMLAFAAALGALIYGYMFWSCFWGFPTVWRWWRSVAAKLYALFSRVEFTTIVTMFVVALGLLTLPLALGVVLLYFYSLFWVGFFYSFFGGGVYQFLKTRKIAKSNALAVDSRA
jgi:hypothetical protein